jgi:hypothetical protein
MNASLAVFQAQGLFAAAEHITVMWCRESDPALRPLLAIAAALTAHAAADALLNEHVANQKTGAQLRKWSGGSLAERLKSIDSAAPEDVIRALDRLTDAKNALAHSEPSNERSIRVGQWTAAEGPSRAFSAVCSLREHLSRHR